MRSILDLHPLLQLHRHGSTRPARHPTCACWLINRPLDTVPGGPGAWGPMLTAPSTSLFTTLSLHSVPISFPGYLSVGFSDALHMCHQNSPRQSVWGPGPPSRAPSSRVASCQQLWVCGSLPTSHGSLCKHRPSLPAGLPSISLSPARCLAWPHA